MVVLTHGKIDQCGCHGPRVQNGLAERVHVIEAAGFDHPDFAAAAPFDLVFANILKGPLLALAPDMARHISPGGHAILSGILNPQADEVVGCYEAEGFKAIERRELSAGDGDRSGLCRRPSGPRRSATA